MGCRRKIFNRRSVYQGITFDSADEMERYIDLKCRELRGEVSSLRLQYRFCIIAKQQVSTVVHLKRKDKTVTKTQERAAYYTCDFMYREGEHVVIEDVKSRYTGAMRDYVLRRKLMIYKINKHNARRGVRRFIFRESLNCRSGFKTTDK